MTKRFIITALVSMLALLAVPQPAINAQGPLQEELYFSSVSSTCEAGQYTVDLVLPIEPEPGDFIPDAVVIVTDQDGTYLGEDTFKPAGAGQYSGTVNYVTSAQGPVTFDLYIAIVFPDDIVIPPGFPPNGEPVSDEQEGDSPLDDIIFTDGGILIPFDQAVSEVNCGAVAAPGCDAQIPLDGAVSGAFTQTTTAYWEPSADAMTSPPVTIEAGKTYYVFGQDASERYYKVLLNCTFLWVPKDTVGPNYDAVWNGTPLPTTIVE
jgi:hypothetical protein